MSRSLAAIKAGPTVDMLHGCGFLGGSSLTDLQTIAAACVSLLPARHFNGKLNCEPTV